MLLRAGHSSLVLHHKGHLLVYLSGVPEIYGADARPKKLEWMLRQAKSVACK